MPDQFDPTRDLTKLEKAEFVDRLAKAARNRFDGRRGYEWQICFAAWTAFGAGAGLAVNAKEWFPSDGERWGATLFALTIVGMFAAWAWARDWRDSIDLRTNYFWETVLEGLIGYRLHKKLRPKAWPSIHDPDAEGADDPTESDKFLLSLKWKLTDRAWMMQAAVTFCFAGLFIVAVWCKPRKEQEKATKITIESNQALQAESNTSKVNIGPPAGGGGS